MVHVQTVVDTNWRFDDAQGARRDLKLRCTQIALRMNKWLRLGVTMCGQCRRGVNAQPLVHVRSSRGGLEDAFVTSATTGGLHFSSCNRFFVYLFFSVSAKTFRLVGALYPENRKR
jgi:hypothetical protein